MNKLTMKEIQEIIDLEDQCGVNNLLQEIFSSEYSEGMDVIEDEHGNYQVVKGDTLTTKESK